MGDYAQRNLCSRRLDQIDGASKAKLRDMEAVCQCSLQFECALLRADSALRLCQNGCQELTHSPLRKIERPPGQTSAHKSDVTAALHELNAQAVIRLSNRAHFVQDSARKKGIVHGAEQEGRTPHSVQV